MTLTTMMTKMSKIRMIPVCVLMWVVRWSDRLNSRRQIRHWKGFWPGNTGYVYLYLVAIYLKVLQNLLLTNVFLQRCSGLPVCIRMCRVSSSLRENLRSHSFTGQAYGRSCTWIPFELVRKVTI